MRQLLGRANSSNVMKVIWLLEEIGLPYERHDVGGKFGGTATPAYRALNPNGIVPTLVEDDFVLWESNVILRYLAGAHPGPHSGPHSGANTLWPHDPRARANVDRWMDWQQTTLGPQMTPVFWGLVRHTPVERDHAAIATAAARLGELYGILDRMLVDSDYIAGPDLTLCDISIGVHAHRWFNFDGLDRPSLPHLRAWYDRLLARPAYRDHVAQLPLT